MSEPHVYKTVQITGSSSASSDEAIRFAIAKASKSVHNLRWFRVTDTRGHIEGDRVARCQVSIELGFTLD
jgi:flavin-binding protein dodecin